MRQKQNSERQTKVTTNPFIAFLRRISHIFGDNRNYLYFCSVKLIE